MSHSTFTPLEKKWYCRLPYVFWGFYGWSEEDRKLALQEIEEDRRAKRDANLMMAEYHFKQASGWVFDLNPDVRTMEEWLSNGLVRSNAVRKWLRDFWAEEDSAIPEPQWIELTPCGPRARP